MGYSLTDPATLLMLCVFVGFIVGIHMTVFGLLRGDKRVKAEASKWLAVANAARTRRQQEAQFAELHQAVQQLQTPPAPTEDHAPHA